MTSFIVVLVALLALAAILVGVAFYKGLFRLATVSPDKVSFILMRKKDATGEGKDSAPVSPNVHEQPPKTLVLPGPAPETDERK